MVMVARVAVERFLFRDFPRCETFTSLDYKKDAGQNTEEKKNKRLAEWTKICVFGLGYMYWGATIGVLDAMHKKNAEWITPCHIYFAISLVTMLSGVAAASFPKSAPWAVGIAGLGAWKAFMFVLVTFHIGSLKFHDNSRECLWSAIICCAIVTIYWGYSSQDPLVIHVLVKTFLWIICLLAYGICCFMYTVYRFIIWIMSVSCRLFCTRQPKFAKFDKSLKESLLSGYYSARAREQKLIQ